MNRPALYYSYSILLVLSFVLSSCQTENPPHDIPITVWYGQNTHIDSVALQAAKEAGFDQCIFEFGDPAINERALSITDRLGLKVILTDEKIERYTSGIDSTLYAVDSVVTLYSRHASFRGPVLAIKPGLSDFPRIGDLADYIRSKHPTLQPFIQALPVYASPARMDTVDYAAYLSLFAQKLYPSELAVEHFAIQKDGQRTEFFPNLAIMRQIAIAEDIPFWAFARIVPFDDYPEPVHSHIRLQLFAGLAFGAKGIQYFALMPPQSRTTDYGDGLLTWNGRPSAIWAEARQINYEIKKLAPILGGLTSTGVAFSKPLPSGASGFVPGMPIAKIDAPTMLAGFFKDQHGDTFVMLVNTDLDYGKLAVVTFVDNVKAIIEVPKNAMPAEEYRWDDNEIEKAAQLLFRAGDGRLFKILE